MMMLTIPILLALSILFPRLSHPLSMGLTLLLQTIVISFSSGLSTPSFWFSYILFMIFLGGMLVLFIYVTSLASNEVFVFPMTVFLIYSSSACIITLCCLFIDPLLTPFMTMLPSSAICNFTTTPLTVSWIYSNISMMFTLFIVLYLLLTLIVVVKITNLFKGPLRLTN